MDLQRVVTLGSSKLWTSEEFSNITSREIQAMIQKPLNESALGKSRDAQTTN